MKLVITIKGLPPMANGSYGSWQKNHAIKKKWKNLVAQELVGQAPARPFERIRVAFVRCSTTEPDYDGLVHGFKPVRDALVRFGFVEDDKNRNMDATYTWEKAPKGQGHIRVEIEEAIP